MTIRELFAWGEKNNALDLDIEIYREAGEAFDSNLDPYVTERTLSYNTGNVVLL